MPLDAARDRLDYRKWQCSVIVHAMTLGPRATSCIQAALMDAITHTGKYEMVIPAEEAPSKCSDLDKQPSKPESGVPMAKPRSKVLQQGRLPIVHALSAGLEVNPAYLEIYWAAHHWLLRWLAICTALPVQSPRGHAKERPATPSHLHRRVSL